MTVKNAADDFADAEAFGSTFDRSRLVDRVYDQLKLAILHGSLEPGERLVQDDLAARFRVSRSPVREAIARLSQEGYVHLEPHRGATVATLTVDEMDEIYEIREILEPRAAVLATQRATDEQIVHVLQLQEEAESKRNSMDMRELFRVNGLFHSAVIEGCQNRSMIAILSSLWERQISFRMFTLYTEERGAIERMLDEHGAIADALRNRADGRIGDRVSAHLREARRATQQGALSSRSTS